MDNNTGNLAREIEFVVGQVKLSSASIVSTETLTASPGDGLRKFAIAIKAMPEDEVSENDLHAVKIALDKCGGDYTEMLRSLSDTKKERTKKKEEGAPTEKDSASVSLRKFASILPFIEDEMIIDRMVKAAHVLRAKQGLTLLSDKIRGER